MIVIRIYVVVTSTQDYQANCRAFEMREDAERYAATAREWMAQRWQAGPGHRLSQLNPRCFFPHDHRADLVIEALASCEIWPFGQDPHSEFFEVQELDLAARSIPLIRAACEAARAFLDEGLRAAGGGTQG